MIDIHTHLLPGIDDGPATLEEAVALAKACVATGVSHAFVAPHIQPGTWNNKRSTIGEHFELYRYALQRLHIPLTLSMAGEVRLTGDVIDLLGQDEIPFLGTCNGRRTMLLEMPDGSIPVGTDRLVRYLMDHQVQPVIVHPERNKAVMEKHERIRPFVEMGCLLQLTAASVIGEFGKACYATSHLLLKEDWVSVVASDAHNLKGRAPRMDAARVFLAKHYGEARADDLTLHAAARITGMSLVPAAA